MIDLIRRLSLGQSLTEGEAAAAMRIIMRGEARSVQIAGFAMALCARGAAVDEIVGMARAAREFGTPVPFGSDVLDTCGTGGDALGTFNISTASAIVAAASGARVAKHGNRSASSACGSADVLEELGVRIDLGPEEAAHCLATTGITFLFAPLYHPAFKHVAGPRRELGVRTVFNLLGPLCNPAHARFQILGVPEATLIDPLAEVLCRLGVDRALVFHSADGMDELSTGAVSYVTEITGGHRRSYRFDPAELGFARTGVTALAGGDRQVNAGIIHRVLGGEEGPPRDVVLLNAAAALLVSGLATDWRDGLARAAESIDSGQAADLLARWCRVSQGREVIGAAPAGGSGPVAHPGNGGALAAGSDAGRAR